MSDEAGASTQREFERRAANDAERRRANRGRAITWTIVLPMLAAALVVGVGAVINSQRSNLVSTITKQAPEATAKPMLSTSIILLLAAALAFVTLVWCLNTFWGVKRTTVAYEKGAVGERATAALLKPLTAAGWVVLHDRRIPGRRENIDHLAIGPHGVAVVETKQWTGRVLVTPDGLKRQGRDEAKVLDQVLRQVDAVRAVLLGGGDAVTEVRPIVCIHRADIERPRSSKKKPNRPRGVRVADRRGLVPALTDGPAVLDELAVERVAGLLSERLPAAPTPAERSA